MARAGFAGALHPVRAQNDMRRPQFALSSNGDYYRRGGSAAVNDAKHRLRRREPSARVVDSGGPLAKLAAIGCKDSWSVQSP